MPSLEHDRWMNRIERAIRELKSPTIEPKTSRNDVDGSPLGKFDSPELHHTVPRGNPA